MNKFKKISVLSMLAISTMFVGCNEDDATGASTTMATPDVNGEITVPFTGVTNLNETDEDTFTYSVTIDKPQVVDIHLRVAQISGSATAGDDFVIPTEIVIPAFATTASGTVKIVDDCVIEGVEDFTIQIGDAANSNAKIAAKTLSFTINNYLSNDLELEFSYNKAFSISGTNYNLCAATASIAYDIDFVVYNEDFSAIVDGTQGATADCVEAITFNDTTFPTDGTYHVLYQIFDNAGITGVHHDPFTIPITVDYSRCGGIDHGVMAIEDDYAPTTLSPNGTEDYVVTVTKTAGVYTIKNSLSEVVVSGRSGRSLKQLTAAARSKYVSARVRK